MNIFDILNGLNWLGDWLADAVKHFWLAFFVGLAAYLLTSTIYSVLCSAWERGTRRRVNTVVDYCIHILLVGLAIWLALQSHAWLDGFAIWYNAPLDPPLNLVVP